MVFKDIIGHQETKNALVRSVQNNHVAHAQLFDGAPGGANYALAWAFATYLNCENKQADDACGRCASCTKMAKLVHPDVYHVFPTAISPKVKGNSSEVFMPLWRAFVGASPYRTLSDWLVFIDADNKQGNISAEEARSVVKRLSLKAFEAEYKVMFVWLPELMNVTSANALLKILEEPPAKTLFLLVTNQSDKLLTTIISRTQRVAVRAFEDDEVAQYLQQKNVEEKLARQTAYLADGNLSAAYLMATEATDDRHEWFTGWMRDCYKPALPELVKRAEGFDAQPKERQKAILDYTTRLFREVFLWQQDVRTLVRLQDDELKFVQNFAGAIKPSSVEGIVNEISQAYYHLERNARAKILFLDLSLTLARLMRS